MVQFLSKPQLELGRHHLGRVEVADFKSKCWKHFPQARSELQ